MNEIIETGLFAQASRESGAKELLAHLSNGQLDANGACGAQIFNLQAEAATVASETALATGALKQAAYEALATGVLKQAARDLRRFHNATTGVERDLYLDAYSWIRANDFSWPYSFVNVCKLLDACPEVVRAELGRYLIRQFQLLDEAWRPICEYASHLSFSTFCHESQLAKSRHRLAFSVTPTAMKTHNHTTSWLRRIRRSITGTNNHKHDWLLVYSMAAFNFDGGWQQLLLKCQNSTLI